MQRRDKPRKGTRRRPFNFLGLSGRMDCAGRGGGAFQNHFSKTQQNEHLTRATSLGLRLR
jgi:hypothetical protein